MARVDPAVGNGGARVWFPHDLINDRQHEDRSERLVLGERLLDKQERSEDQQKDPDPRQAGTAGVVGPPFPVVDANIPFAGQAAAAVRAESGDGFLWIAHGPPSGA